MGYSFRLTARVLLYASSHRQDSTYHSLCYTSRGALAGTRNSSMCPPHEGSIRRPIAPWANAPKSEVLCHKTHFIDHETIHQQLWCEVTLIKVKTPMHQKLYDYIFAEISLMKEKRSKSYMATFLSCFILPQWRDRVEEWAHLPHGSDSLFKQVIVRVTWQIPWPHHVAVVLPELLHLAVERQNKRLKIKPIVSGRKEGNVLFNDALNTFYLRLYGIIPDSEKWNPLPPHFPINNKGSFICTIPDRITHTTAFVSPVVELRLEWEIAQWVHPMKDRSNDPSHHERTLLPRSYISLLLYQNHLQHHD